MVRIYKLFLCLLLAGLFFSCSESEVTIRNEKEGQLVPTYVLESSGQKKFPLDSVTAPKAPFIQVHTDSVGNRQLALLNPYSNSIYFFDYDRTDFIHKITFNREGSNAILSVGGYYILNADSIFIFNRALVEMVLADGQGHVKERIALHSSNRNWSQYYPQFTFRAVNPILRIDNELLLSGFSPFSIRDSLIHKINITERINVKSLQVDHMSLYPEEIYGNDANWDDPTFMQPYTTLSPQNEIVYSFPPSHNLYVMDTKTQKMRVVYGGSNVAHTNTSIDWDLDSGRTPDTLIREHFLHQDLYGGILYDPWREVYYRFLEQRASDVTNRTPLTSKAIIIICMDKDFNYLGETNIGTGKQWNWNNAFVTKEGLNIEYLDINDMEELYMNFKIFTLKKI